MRKEIDITITDAGRDQGKVFHIREKPAAQAEKWAMRALMAAAKAGVDIGDLGSTGMAGIAMLGIQAIIKVNFDDVEPLLDELMTCVSVKPDPSNPQIVRVLFDDDIEEVTTRIHLRSEVLKLHMDFLKLVSPSTQTTETSTPAGSSTTPMSPQPSVQFSQQERQR